MFSLHYYKQALIRNKSTLIRFHLHILFCTFNIIYSNATKLHIMPSYVPTCTNINESKQYRQVTQALIVSLVLLN